MTDDHSPTPNSLRSRTWLARTLKKSWCTCSARCLVLWAQQGIIIIIKGSHDMRCCYWGMTQCWCSIMGTPNPASCSCKCCWAPFRACEIARQNSSVPSNKIKTRVQGLLISCCRHARQAAETQAAGSFHGSLRASVDVLTVHRLPCMWCMMHRIQFHSRCLVFIWCLPPAIVADHILGRDVVWLIGIAAIHCVCAGAGADAGWLAQQQPACSQKKIGTVGCLRACLVSSHASCKLWHRFCGSIQLTLHMLSPDGA